MDHIDSMGQFDIPQATYSTKPSGSPLDIELFGAIAASRVLDAWQRFEATVESCPLACTSAWTRLWLEHYGDLVPHSFAVLHEAGNLRGFVLLTEGVGIKAGPFPVKTLHCGTAGEPEAESVCVEYNGFCVRDGDRDDLHELLRQKIERLDGWDELWLDGFPSSEAGAFLQLFHSEPNITHDVSNCHYHDLKAARQADTDALTQLGYSTRKTIRKNLKAYGDLRAEWAEDVDHAEAILADLVQLHQDRWTAVGEAGCYSSERFLNFHRELIRRFLPIGRTALFRVFNGRNIVGCNHLLIDGRRVLAYQGGAAAYEGKLSPGLILDYLCVEECRRRGYDAYDFLAKESHHKIRLSTHCTTLSWSRLRRPRTKYVVVDTLKKLKQLVANS